MSDFFTIGHSTRSMEEFAALLRASGVGVVVDVRVFPRSRRNPQFNEDVLPESLAAFQVGYTRIPELGGFRRSSSKTSPNGFWKNQSFRNYADYALTADFASGLSLLETIGEARTAAIMCAEAVWWRCHRRIIADYLLSRGRQVFHILGPGSVAPATLTPGAQVRGSGEIIYSPE